jgi:hypothetical protein
LSPASPADSAAEPVVDLLNGEQPALFPHAFLIIAATAFAVVFPFLLLGVLAGHDFAFHMNSWMEVAAQWKQGIFYPRWAALANYGYGEPRFIFYPPISWMVGAALGTVLPWVLVPGAFVWIALTLSGCSMFLLARTWLGRRDAVFAAALYATNPYYLVIVYWRSDFAELLAGALLPLLLLYSLHTHESERKALVALSVIVALAWLTNAPVGVMVNYSLLLLVAIHARMQRSWRAIGIGVASLTLGMGLATFYLLPAAYEQRWVEIGKVLAFGFRPQDNFLFCSIGDTGHDAFNRLLTMIAIGQIVVIILAIPLVLGKRTIPKTDLVALLVWTPVAVFLLFSVSLPIWNIFPKLQFLQFPWRWLLCTNVAFVLFVTIAFQKRYLRTGLYLATLGMLIFGAWRIQRPWKDTAEDIGRMAELHSSGKGYKSRPEYIPLGADVSQIDPNVQQAVLQGNRASPITRPVWNAESKIILVNAPTSDRLLLRLFNYPAWNTDVNGSPVRIEPIPSSGRVSIPVSPGENRVVVRFNRTGDRWWGGIVSAISLVLIAFLGFKPGLREAA